MWGVDIYSAKVISANHLRAGAGVPLVPGGVANVDQTRPVLIESGVIMFSVSTSPLSTLQCPLQRKLSPANISTLHWAGTWTPALCQQMSS